jgi:hypothetical protein
MSIAAHRQDDDRHKDIPFRGLLIQDYSEKKMTQIVLGAIYTFLREQLDFCITVKYLCKKLGGLHAHYMKMLFYFWFIFVAFGSLISL